ncbi:hypothetical protein CJ030_MR2G013107 [Morella rubra]|uniref:Uncharacterized protein n=1 Tax=Morella rubra TaxID=262757 RepID=A0A6A1W926_9ROSI|nr:hypothetical protein CJ030_MR2G013107 [Morella rubra]
MDLEEPSMEVTIRNVQITFWPDELVRFLGYERNLTTFPNLPLSNEDRPIKAEVFRKLLGLDTAIFEGSNIQHMQLLPFWRIMHLILCSAIDPRKHTTELSYGWAKFLYLVVIRGQPVDMESYIYQTIHAKALKTDVQISLSYGILLTQFLHTMLPTHEMVGDISSRLTAFKCTVKSMDNEWKKEVAAVQSVLKGMAMSAKLLSLTEQVVLLKEHMRQVHEVLQLADDEQ